MSECWRSDGRKKEGCTGQLEIQRISVKYTRKDKNASVSILHTAFVGVQGDEAVGEGDRHENKLDTSSSEAILSLHGRVWMTMATI